VNKIEYLSAFRTYGSHVSINGYTFPSRHEEASGYQQGSDIITVGKLDGNKVGPYNKETVSNIALKWAWLRDTEEHIQELKHPPKIQLYKKILRKWFRVQEDELCKKNVLQKQIDLEKEYVLKYIQQAVKDIKLQQEDTQALTLYFEVGNEPNHFPYIPPEMYAWYYQEWYQIIIQAVEIWNRDSSVTVETKIMPGGVILSHVITPEMRDILSRGIILRYKDIELVADGNMNTIEYWDIFIQNLGGKVHHMIDIVSLHTYPILTESYSVEDSLEELKKVSHHILNTLGTESHKKEIWLTEIGNLNPRTIEETINNFARPILVFLKEYQVPAIARWYWYKGRGVDPKLNVIPPVWILKAIKVLFPIGLFLLDTYSLLCNGVNKIFPRLLPSFSVKINIRSVWFALDWLSEVRKTPPTQCLVEDVDKGEPIPNELGKLYEFLARK
jgi:hypothetical protein